MNLYQLSLTEIKEQSDPNTVEENIKEYQTYFKNWEKLGIPTKELQYYYGDPIEEVDFELQQIYENGISFYYPNIKRKRARKSKYCSFCNTKILKGSKYYCYHPFIILKNTEEEVKKVLSCGNLFICECCQTCIPKTYEELELLKENFALSNENEDLTEEICYEGLKERTGESLDFKILTRKKKKKIS